MKRYVLAGALAGVAVLACSAALRAAVIPIPNGDFMAPDESTNPYTAGPDIASWQKGVMPNWWTNGADAWYQTTGVFYNAAGPTHITNLTTPPSQQAAFLFAAPQVELYQNLTATYDVGQSYHLNFGLIPSDGSTYAVAIQDGTPIEAVLYYMEGDVRTPVAYTVVANSAALLASHTVMSNFTVDTAVVQAGDLWAGKPIGIQFLSLADFGNLGGVWDIGNVQLTATPVPEAGSLGMLAVGAVLLMRRRRK